MLLAVPSLQAASKVIVLVHDVTADFEPKPIVSSVGYLTLEPNSPIVVPRRVHLVADSRASSPAIVQNARMLLLERNAPVAQKHDLTINVKDFDVRPVQSFPEKSLETCEKVAADIGVGKHSAFGFESGCRWAGRLCVGRRGSRCQTVEAMMCATAWDAGCGSP
ncbi:hypothetical protein [Streptomyces sp. NPDC056669]|uniref:hypothetical protein n=1 Tax=unclassified Streptomyces TaxID=2593676 RepID=UPI00365E4B84